MRHPCPVFRRAQIPHLATAVGQAWSRKRDATRTPMREYSPRMSAEPFLPEPEVIAAPPSKKSGVKTLVLWVILIVMFLTIWQFLTPAERQPASNMNEAADATHQICAAACTSSASSSWSTILALSPLLIVVVLAYFFLRAYKLNDTFNLAQEPGRLAMVHRRFDEAAALFRASVPRFAKQPAYLAMAVLNVGEALLRAGRLDESIATFAEVERSRVLLLGSGVRTRIATHTALVYALSGDTALAERWTTDARMRIAKNKEDRLGHAAQLCLAEAILSARKGDHAAAVALLDARWLEMRFSLNADSFRAVEVVRTFAETQRGVRASNAAAERLIRIEPVSKGEFAYLGVKWPEMKLFLDAHGVAAPTA